MESLNKRLALLLWAKDKNGEDDVAVYSGTLVKENGVFLFYREEFESPEIRNEWLSRIKPIPENMKEMLLGCDYQLSLTVGDSEKSEVKLEAFGLKWPNA